MRNNFYKSFQNNIQSGKIYQLIITIVIAMTGVQLAAPVISADIELSVICTASLLPVLLIAGYQFTKLKGRIILTLSFLFSISIPLFVFGKEQTFSFLYGFSGWLSGMGQWEAEFVKQYQFLIMTAIAFFLCAVAAVINKTSVIRWGVCICSLAYLVYNMLSGRTLSQLTVCLILFFFLLCYVEYMQKREAGDNHEEGKKSTICLLPFLMLFLCGIIFFPADKGPYEWNHVRNVFSHIKSAVNTVYMKWDNLFSGEEEFQMLFGGLSDSAIVGGDVASRNKELMLISANNELRASMYLTSNIYDTFDGKEWTRTDTRQQEDYFVEFIELMYAIQRYGEGDVTDYVRSTAINIQYRNINTYHLFAPAKIFRIKMDENPDEYYLEGGELLFREIKGYNTRYDLNYMQMNIDHPEFYEMMKKESMYRYGMSLTDHSFLMDELKDHYALVDQEAVTEQYLKDRAEEISGVYLDTGEKSEQIVNFLDDITRGADHPVDKLKAIEQHLKQYQYTKQPGDIPKGKDFMEYFLFESKEGYCTYFATAFALLARYEGIPARYVQGLCVPVDRSNLDEVQVLSDMAHAWPEAYIEGVGWIPFEPTPDYGELRYMPWRTKKQIEENNAQKHYEINEPEWISEGVDTEDQLPESAVFEEENTVNYVLIFGIACILIMFIFIAYILDITLRRFRYKRMGQLDRLIMILTGSLTILGDLDYPMEEGETLQEYQIRLSDEAKILLPSLKSLLLFEEIRYGSRAADSDIIKLAVEEQKKLLVILRDIHRLKYYRRFFEHLSIE